jgi:predicted HicB family RNase H-like nuclease
MNSNNEFPDRRDAQYPSDYHKKTRSVTFRLDSFTIDELQREANQKEISLNVLVNQILKRYSDWDRYENRIGMMPVPKVMLTSLIDKAITLAKNNGLEDIEPFREEIIKQAAVIAFNLMKDSVLFMKKQYNLWAVLSVLEEYMKISGIKADHKIESGRKHIFIIQHELGENWSLFTKELLRIIFENLAKVRIESSITPNTTIAEVIL